MGDLKERSFLKMIPVPHFFFSLAIRFAAEEDRVKVVVATGSIESLRLVFALPYGENR